MKRKCCLLTKSRTPKKTAAKQCPFHIECLKIKKGGTGCIFGINNSTTRTYNRVDFKTNPELSPQQFKKKGIHYDLY
jgi:hypothetical protein